MLRLINGAGLRKVDRDLKMLIALILYWLVARLHLWNASTTKNISCYDAVSFWAMVWFDDFIRRWIAVDKKKLVQFVQVRRYITGDQVFLAYTHVAKLQSHHTNPIPFLLGEGKLS